MVGIVIVSHSAKLADGVTELAQNMAGTEVRIAAAGGMDLPDRPLGTDANLIYRAIEQVYEADGVLVLMDLGSAILSAEMAVEMLPPEVQKNVLLCEAPLVEGALAAAVQARLGNDLTTVANEARGALAPKAAQLDSAMPVLHSATGADIPHDGTALRLTIHNRLGLHARPAARLVRTVGQFNAEVTLRNTTNGRGPVSARSVTAVATLGVLHGHEVEFIVSGIDTAAVIETIRDLVEENFGEDDSAIPVPAARASQATRVIQTSIVPGQPMRGIGASRGIVVAQAVVKRPGQIDVPQGTIDDVQAGIRALEDAITRTRDEIVKTLEATRRHADQDTAEIFEAHLLFLDDEALTGPAFQSIANQQLNPAAAWDASVQAMVDQFQRMEDDYLRLRAADVRDVGDQVLAALLGLDTRQFRMAQPGILVAVDLNPTQTATLDPATCLGLVLAQGAATSHAAIIARAMSIPAVVAVGAAVLDVDDGALLALDGEVGLVIPYPDNQTRADYEARARTLSTQREEARRASAQPAVTRDGRAIEIAANIGSAADVPKAIQAGAEGVGLFRTEFLFLDRRTAPDEGEQYTAYRAAAQALGGRPLVIRTLDVGGDKPLPYIDQGQEQNPFLGWRAIRLCLAQPELFKTQLRAMLRVAAEYPVKIMFPMIANVDEFRAAVALMNEARGELRRRSMPAPERVDTGIMVEIPSAALLSAHFAAEVDFFSIGTNDLVQYTLAVERGNPRVAPIADPLNPAVLQLISATCAAAHAYGKWVSVCGEAAGDPVIAPVLLGLGVDKLSMNATAVPEIKQVVRSIRLRELASIAQSALSLESGDAVRDLLARS